MSFPYNFIRALKYQITSEEVSKKSASERGEYNMPTYWETNRIKIQLKKYSNYLLKFQVPDLDFYYLTCNIYINKN